MNTKSTVDCPDCHSSIHIDTQLLLTGASFCCSNQKCGISIKLSTEDQSTVSEAMHELEKLEKTCERSEPADPEG